VLDLLLYRDIKHGNQGENKKLGAKKRTSTAAKIKREKKFLAAAKILGRWRADRAAAGIKGAGRIRSERQDKKSTWPVAKSSARKTIASRPYLRPGFELK
jgi:hypothetical protein